MSPREKTAAKDKLLHIFALSPALFHIVFWPVMRPLFWFFLRMEVRYTEKLLATEGKRVIFAVSHRNETDPVVLQYALPFWTRFLPIYFVSLSKEWYPFKKFGIRSLFYGGLVFKLMGAYPVYRGLRNFEVALQHHIDILEKNHSVVIFPEGRVSEDGTIGEAKPGYIFLAKRTQTPIVPVKIDGTFKLGFWSFLTRKHKVVVTFGDPIDCGELRDVDSEIERMQLKQEAMEVMSVLKNL